MPQVQIPISLAAWWRLVQPPAPHRLHVERIEVPGDKRGAARLYLAGNDCGIVYPHALGTWLNTLIVTMPNVLMAAEDLAIHRALLLTALAHADRAAAAALAAQLGTTLDASDVFYGVGDACEHALLHEHLDADDDPPEPW